MSGSDPTRQLLLPTPEHPLSGRRRDAAIRTRYDRTHCIETKPASIRIIRKHRLTYREKDMSDNKGLIQELYRAFGRGDVPFVLANLADAVEWVSTCDPAIIPWGGKRHGKQGVLSFFESLGSNLDFNLFEPAQFAADGDLVFVRGRTVATHKPTGRQFDSEWVHIFTIANGRVQRFQEFYDTAAIIAAIRGN